MSECKSCVILGQEVERLRAEVADHTRRLVIATAEVERSEQHVEERSWEVRRLREQVTILNELRSADGRVFAEQRGRLEKVVDLCHLSIEYGEKFSKERGFAAAVLEIVAAQPEENNP